MGRLSRLSLRVFALSFSLISARVFAETLWVPTQFLTIQEAVDASSDGDSIHVLPSVYYEAVGIPRRNLTVISNFAFTRDSADIANCVIQPGDPPAGRCISVSGGTEQGTVRVEGLTLHGGDPELNTNTSGLYLAGGNVILEHCILDSFRCPEGAAFYVSSGALVVRNSRVRHVGSSSNGNVAHALNSTLLFDSCELSELASFNAEIGTDFFCDNGSLHFRDCSIHGAGRTGFGSRFIYMHNPLDTLTFVGSRIWANGIYTFLSRRANAMDRHGTYVRFDSNLVDSNAVYNNLFLSDEFFSGSVSVIRDNRFIGNFSPSGTGGRGLFLASGLNWSLMMTGNLFTGNQNGEYSCLALGEVNDRVQVHHNYFLSNWTSGAVANPPGGAIVLIDSRDECFRENVLVGNSGYAAFCGLYSFPPGHAENCYWGDSSGPYNLETNPGGLGDSVDNNIVYEPWAADTTFGTDREPGITLRPTDFLIGFAYPNPFNSVITIEFATTKSLHATLQIYDLLGREIATLLDEQVDVGIHRKQWSPENAASGIYFARLSSTESPQTPWLHKLVLIK